MTWAPSSYRVPPTPEAKLEDAWWRIGHLYRVIDEKGKDLPFIPNAVQADYYWKQWYLNIILKSRQHGFTTLCAIIALDHCLWRKNFHAHIVADTRENSERLFEEKMRWPARALREQFPELKAVSDTVEDNARVLRFPNGSTLSSGTSMRGGTLQMLHVSEHGKICAKQPEKAKEIRSGALNTVHVGQLITIESTAEGREGDFYEFAELARKVHEAKKPLTPLDFKFHFYAWWQDAKNTLPPADVIIPKETEEYFDKLKILHGIKLTPGKKAWYTKKLQTQRDLMYREHPSTPPEAFQGATEGTLYGGFMIRAREQGRIVDHIPFDARIPVNTTWDLGKSVNNETAVWFHQYARHAGTHKWVWYEEKHSEGLAYWYNRLMEMREQFGFVYGKHYFPHDVEVSDLSLAKGETRKDRLEELGLRNIVVVERVPSLMDGVEAVRGILPNSIFSEKTCAQGIIHLENYRREWDERTQSHKDTPLHDQSSNGADAFRQLAQEYRPEIAYSKRKTRDRSWRTA